MPGRSSTQQPHVLECTAQTGLRPAFRGYRRWRLASLTLLMVWFGEFKKLPGLIFFLYQSYCRTQSTEGFPGTTAWTLFNPMGHLACVRCYCRRRVLLQCSVFLTWAGPARRAVAGTLINVWLRGWTTHFIISLRCLPWITQTVPKTFTACRHSWLLNRVHQTLSWKLNLAASLWRSPISLDGSSVVGGNYPIK